MPNRIKFDVRGLIELGQINLFGREMYTCTVGLRSHWMHRTNRRQLPSLLIQTLTNCWILTLHICIKAMRGSGQVIMRMISRNTETETQFINNKRHAAPVWKGYLQRMGCIWVSELKRFHCCTCHIAVD